VAGLPKPNPNTPQGLLNVPSSPMQLMLALSVQAVATTAPSSSRFIMVGSCQLGGERPAKECKPRKAKPKPNETVTDPKWQCAAVLHTFLSLHGGGWVGQRLGRVQRPQAACHLQQPQGGTHGPPAAHPARGVWCVRGHATPPWSLSASDGRVGVPFSKMKSGWMVGCRCVRAHSLTATSPPPPYPLRRPPRSLCDMGT
jgi:hypothetical protein